MTPQQIKQYILIERDRGTSDRQIYDAIKDNLEKEKTERGFAGEILPVGGAILGGIGGAIIGGTPTIGIGAGPGAMGGAAIGGAIGETAQQAIERFTSKREEFAPGQIVGTGIISGLAEGAGQLAFKAGAKILTSKPVKMAVETLRPKIIETISHLSGYGKDLVQKALERTPGAVKAIQGGEKILNEMIERSTSKISQLAKESVKATRSQVDELAKIYSLGGKGQIASRNMILKEGTKFIDNITNSLRSAHNIGVASDGNLLFNRLSRPSRIVAGGDQRAIQEGFNAVKSIANNTSIKHIDAILEKLIVLKIKTPVGSPTGSQTKAIIGEMIESITNFTKNTYPKYFEFLSQNLPKRIAIEEAKELFGGTAKLSPLELSRVSGRLLQLYNTGRLPIRETMEEIGKEIGEDITGTTAGTIMSIDDAISFRARQLGARGIVEKLVEAVPRKIVDTYIATGKVTGEMLSHPAILKITQGLRMSAKTVMQFIANLSASKKSD